MSNVVALENKIEQVIMNGDLSKLSSDERLSYLKKVCESLGLNPYTRPFDYITLQGRMILYARRECAEQLRKIHGVSIAITSKEVINGVYVVSAKAKDRLGKEDESTGAVPIAGLNGLDLSNAMMKAETKAKRRVTLSVCGLGILDESEVEDDRSNVSEPPKEQTKILTNSVEKYSDLVKAFAEQNVTKYEIAEHFGLNSIDELSPAHVEDLKNIFRDLRSGKTKKTQIFNQGAEA